MFCCCPVLFCILCGWDTSSFVALFGYIFPARVSIPITRVAVGEFVLCVVQTLERHGIVWSEIYSMCTRGWCVQTKPCWKIIQYACCVCNSTLCIYSRVCCMCMLYYYIMMVGWRENLKACCWSWKRNFVAVYKRGRVQHWAKLSDHSSGALSKLIWCVNSAIQVHHLSHRLSCVYLATGPCSDSGEALCMLIAGRSLELWDSQLLICWRMGSKSDSNEGILHGEQGHQRCPKRVSWTVEKVS